MADVSYYGFVWNADKAASNVKKHGVSFETAVWVFNDPAYLEFYDENNSTDTEQRFNIIGRVHDVLVLFITTTERDEATRIISARPATKREQEAYYENLKNLSSY